MSESLPPEKNARDRAFGIACWTLGALAFVLLLMVGVSFSLTARTVVVEKVVETPVPVPVQQNPEGPAAVEEGDEPDTAGIAAVPAGSSEKPRSVEEMLRAADLSDPAGDPVPAAVAAPVPGGEGVSGQSLLPAENPAEAMPPMTEEVAELVKRTAFKITRVGQLVANLASQALGVPAGIIDLSLAPTPAIGDSVANILEEMGLETCGCCGTTACLALLNDAVKKGGVMASNHVGGLSGAFIPVSEDAGMIHAAETGCLTIEKLEAMTAVCSVGIDMVIIPGDTTPAVISALIADEAAIGMVNSKTTAVRVIPAIGRKAGEVLDFGGLLGYGPIMAVNQHDPSVFINRGGRLPAPMQSLKN